MNKILLAHLKKPPFETRIFDKIGKSLSDSGIKRITILGNSIPAGSDFPIPLNIRLYPIFQSKAHSPQISNDLLRFQAFLYLERPDVVVVCSPELLAQAVIYCVSEKKPLVLDLQENYPINYAYQTAYRWPYNKLLQMVSSVYLSVLMPFINKVWVAERVYSEQLQIPQARVIENKIPNFWQKTDPVPFESKSEYFLFTGYITEEAGVLRALNFFIAFQTEFPKMELIIAGYCPSERLKAEIKRRSDGNQGIRLIGLDHWVLSDTILGILKSASAVLMPYQETKANTGKIPTKLYEAASLKIPVILPLNSQFITVGKKLLVPIVEADFLFPETNDFHRMCSVILSHQKERPPFGAAHMFESEKIISEIQNLISEF